MRVCEYECVYECMSRHVSSVEGGYERGNGYEPDVYIVAYGTLEYPCVGRVWTTQSRRETVQGPPTHVPLHSLRRELS